MNIIYNMLDHGSPANDPYKVIIHSMGEHIDNNGDIYTAREWLNFLKLSAHVLVHPNGDIEVCRSDEEGAWHARGHNRDSLGIEFLTEGTREKQRVRPYI